MGTKKSMSHTLGEFLRLRPIPPLCKMDQFNNCYGGRRGGGGGVIYCQAKWIGRCLASTDYQLAVSIKQKRMRSCR